MSQQKKPAPFLHTLISGGIAGVTEICVMYPLDVAKTRAQLHSQGSVSMVNVISTIVKNEGFAKLYRGILPPILMEAPKRALKFASNEYYKGLLTNGGQVPLTQGKAIIAGVSAGCTETFVVVPFELVKIRLQAKENVC
jgi:solute carrier family 25 2-oxodicarboxylate transporter 21